MTAIYDELADDPKSTFRRSARPSDPVDPAALRYWDAPQHGLGANGASSVYLRNRAVTNYDSGDDRFYERITARPTAADDRWRDGFPST